MTTLVDTNVLLDIATNDERWFEWSSTALVDAAEEGTLAINAIIYAELSVGFGTIEAIEEAFPPADFRRLDLPYEAAFLAGKAFLDYKRRSGKRSAPLADFYIGAHAAVEGFRLLTRDATRCRTYFPTLELLAPRV